MKEERIAKHDPPKMETIMKKTDRFGYLKAKIFQKGNEKTNWAKSSEIYVRICYCYFYIKKLIDNKKEMNNPIDGLRTRKDSSQRKEHV